jgi:nucleoside 2-deoxyribosyltransferase
MSKHKKKVYLAGQPNEYENNWKEEFKKLDGFDFYDWEFDSDQTSSDTFFPDDLNGIKNADFMIANPGLATSEGTWIEIGYFYANNIKLPGDFCDKLIIVWREDRNPKWSIEFAKKTGWIVSSIDEAKNKLIEIIAEK